MQPGTGKTSTLVELIMQYTQANLKVLVCAPSNIAVDTILLRLAQAWSRGKEKRMVRLGHPARVSEAVLPYTLDFQINNDEGTEIVSDARKEVDNLRAELRKGYKRGAEGEGMTKRELKQELKAVRKEVVQREREVVRRIVANSQVILATCVGASSRLIESVEFDVVVIDEAAQGLEVACWIPMLLANKVVLAGDHCQLPPTIKCKEASKELSVTLFERIIRDTRYASVCTLLNIQYRMNDLISMWASRQMYHDEVVSDQSVAAHSLADIVEAKDEEECIPVLLMIDTGGCCMYEASQTEQSISHRNLNEVQLVVVHVISLLKQGVLAKHIGIITPYNGQLEVLRSAFSTLAECQHSHGLDLTDLEVKTIDGFQGGEKECIIISLVRSNDRRDVGFLGEIRRINVAVTRAKRHLAVICDTETCSSDSFIASLIAHIEEHGEVLGAEDFLAEHVQDIKLVPANISTQSSSAQQPASKVATEAKKSTGNVKTTTVSKSKSNQKPVTNKKKTDSSSVTAAVDTTQVDIKVESVGNNRFAVEIDELLRNFKSGLGLQQLIHLSSTGYELKRVVTSSLASIHFPCSLNSFERMIVHAAAEKFSLLHESRGEGNGRYIEVSTVLEVPAVPLSDFGGNSSVDADPPPAESSNDLNKDVVDLDDSDEDNDDATVPNTAVKTIDAAALKAKKKSKGKAKSSTVLGPVNKLGGSAMGGVKSSALPDIDDEDMLLQFAIEENQVSYVSALIET
ncbi:hypothetical protein EON65_04960 [archaeon]|nr:MAG: hypothetical protein EON65_04960 [archaeon]